LAGKLEEGKSEREREHLEYIVVGGKIRLKWILFKLVGKA
jgi:hypothetical protein